MAAGNITIFGKNKNNLNMVAAAGATLKLALLTSSATPDATITGNQVWADLSANEIANGFGYTTGGITLASVTASTITGGYKITCTAPVWTASGGSIPAWRYGVIYVSGTLWSLTNPLISYFVGDSTPADIPATSGTLTITPNASGLWDIT